MNQNDQFLLSAFHPLEHTPRVFSIAAGLGAAGKDPSEGEFVTNGGDPYQMRHLPEHPGRRSTSTSQKSFRSQGFLIFSSRVRAKPSEASGRPCSSARALGTTSSGFPKICGPRRLCRGIRESGHILERKTKKSSRYNDDVTHHWEARPSSLASEQTSLSKRSLSTGVNPFVAAQRAQGIT